MSTRCTQTVSRSKALLRLRCIQDNLPPNDILSDLLEELADAVAYAAYNFRVVDGDGPDDHVLDMI
jgi:hypothetical protein